MLENVEVLCHSSIKINKEKVIYIDPFKIDKNYNDADIIFITHDHYDHYSEDDIEKIKKNDSSYESVIELERTEDILSYLGAHKANGQLICGFSMETQNMLENSKAKLAKKNADMIVANNLKVAGAGFGTDTNVVTVITKDAVEELPMMSKEEVADALLDRIMKARQ